jgi:hypothetical protein
VKSLLELSRRDAAFRERRPDPYRAPPPVPGPVERAVERFLPATLATAAGLCLGMLGVAAFLGNLEPRSRWTAPPDDDRRFLNRLEAAVLRYEDDTGALPPADPVGSAALVQALTTPTPSGQLHGRFEPGQLDGDGYLRTPSGWIVHYRGPTTQGRWGFVLWAGDVNGRLRGAATWIR